MDDINEEYQGRHERVAEPTETPGFLTMKQYDFIKVLAQYIFPAIAAFYVGFADIWDLPKALEVAGTIALIDTLLGALLGLAKRSYDNSDAKFDGTILVTPDEENGLTDLNVSLNPEAIAGKSEILVKVKEG